MSNLSDIEDSVLALQALQKPRPLYDLEGSDAVVLAVDVNIFGAGIDLAMDADAAISGADTVLVLGSCRLNHKN